MLLLSMGENQMISQCKFVTACHLSVIKNNICWCTIFEYFQAPPYKTVWTVEMFSEFVLPECMLQSNQQRKGKNYLRQNDFQGLRPLLPVSCCGEKSKRIGEGKDFQGFCFQPPAEIVRRQAEITSCGNYHEFFAVKIIKIPLKPLRIASFTK